MLKKILIGLFALSLISISGLYLLYNTVKKTLPEIIKVEDYKPLLVSQVYDRNNKKFGEFFRERRVLVPYKDIPKHVIEAFLAAEDDQFFQHQGINLHALFRAAIANMRAGRNVQGGSTITQQVAKKLLLTDERTLSRKIRDILLALQMEKNLTKEEILYLYLNQIYFGQSAYGIEMAAQTYFRKSTKELTVAEAAMLAGLPKAPSEYSPVKNPSRAKERQIYVLNRMAEVKYIPELEAQAAIQLPIKVYLIEDYEQMAPYYLETVRLLLIHQLGEEVILDQGVKIYTALDLEAQKAANLAVVKGLKDLDRRQGYRGPLNNLSEEEKVKEFLEKQKKKLISESNPERTILPDGTFAEIEWFVNKKKPTAKANPQGKLPSFLKVDSSYEGIVINVDDVNGFVEVQLPEAKGMIEFESMTWARKPNFEKKSEYDLIKKPSQALKTGDVIQVKLLAEDLQWNKAKFKKGITLPDPGPYLALELDQEPLVEGALLSIDQQSEDVLAMVGGYSFARNQFNRTFQAARQTGSAFKAIVYAAALDRGYNPSTPIIDAPIIYKQAGDDEGQGDEKIWRPSNHGREFNGEITMRNALVKSLNIPAVKIMEDIGVPFATEYSQRLGIFSKLNPDFTLVLGSSSTTLYEMTKVFSQFGRMGLRTRPRMIKKVIDRQGKILVENVSLESRFLDETKPIDEAFAEKKKTYFEKAQAFANSDLSPEHSEELKRNSFYFENSEQLISPQTAYVLTHMLKGVVEDPNGTGARAAQLGRETAGKTGTTNGYVDAWFLGYTPNVATGVWVGFDKEKTLGKSEVGGRSALPIWLDFMKDAHRNLPVLSFPMPEGVKLVKIDADSGKLAHSASKRVITQAYIDGTEPTSAASRSEETRDHLKQDIDE